MLTLTNCSVSFSCFLSNSLSHALHIAFRWVARQRELKKAAKLEYVPNCTHIFASRKDLTSQLSSSVF